MYVKSDGICQQVAKGGEADDALKRVMLDFHTTQLVAQKQALIVLLSGKCRIVLPFPGCCYWFDLGLLCTRVLSMAPFRTLSLQKAIRHCSFCPTSSIVATHPRSVCIK